MRRRRKVICIAEFQYYPNTKDCAVSTVKNSDWEYFIDNCKEEDFYIQQLLIIKPIQTKVRNFDPSGKEEEKYWEIVK